MKRFLILSVVALIACFVGYNAVGQVKRISRLPQTNTIRGGDQVVINHQLGASTYQTESVAWSNAPASETMTNTINNAVTNGTIAKLNGTGTNTTFRGSSATNVSVIINGVAGTNGLQVKDTNANIVASISTDGYYRTTNEFFATLHTTGVTSGQTNDIFTFTPRSNSCVRVWSEIVGFNPTNGCAYLVSGGFKSATNIVTQIGASTIIGSVEDLSLDTALVDVSGTTVRVRVSGTSNAVMDWSAYIKLIYSSP